MQVEALKTFNGRLGLVRTGMIITVDDRYGSQLIKNRLARVHVPMPLEPDRNADLGGPDRTKEGGGEGNGSGAGSEDDNPSPEETSSQQDPESGETDASSEVPRAGGRGQRSSSRQAGRRSRKKT